MSTKQLQPKKTYQKTDGGHLFTRKLRGGTEYNVEVRQYTQMSEALMKCCVVNDDVPFILTDERLNDNNVHHVNGMALAIRTRPYLPKFQ